MSNRGLGISPAVAAALLAGQLLYLALSYLVSSGPASALDPAVVLFPLTLLCMLTAALASESLLGVFLSATLMLAGLGFVPGSQGLNTPYIVALAGVYTVSNLLSRAIAVAPTPASSLPKPFGLLLLLSLLSLAVSTASAWVRGHLNVGLLMGVATFVLAGVVAYFIATGLRDARATRTAIVTCIAVAVVSGVLWLPAMLDAVGKRMLLPFQSVPVGLNEVGEIMAMLVALTVGSLAFERVPSRKLLLGISFLVLSLGLILTKSRGSWVGVIAALAYVAARARRLRTLLFTLTLALVVASAFQPVKDTFVARLSQTEAGDPSWVARLFMWRTAVQIIPSNLLFGVGLHNFGLVKYDYGFPRSLDPLVASFGYRPNQVLYGHTHNLYIELLMDLGVLGATALVALLVLAFLRLNAIAGDRRRPMLRGPALGLAAAVVSFMTHSLFDYTLWISYSLLALATFLGLALATIRLSQLPPEAAPSGE